MRACCTKGEGVLRDLLFTSDARALQRMRELDEVSASKGAASEEIDERQLRAFEVFQLENADADAMAEILTDLFQLRQQAIKTRGAPSRPQPAA